MPNPLFLGSSSASLRYIFFGLFFSFLFSSCSHALHDPAHLVFVIESNPANLDPRYASDANPSASTASSSTAWSNVTPR